MKVAQGLYEGVALGAEGNVGLITYMRTDSTMLGVDAVTEIRDVITQEFGAKALPDAPQVYKTKSKNAQEAHEAVRPTSALRTPQSIAAFLNDDQRKLYELVWKRAVACQMIHATLNTVSVEFALRDVAGDDASFRASGTTVVDPGFLAVYEEGRDQKAAEDDDEGRRLPRMAVGESVPLRDIVADQHFTEPPPRYSEASLVKALEEHGIGRPSTYASIISTIQAREYVWKRGQALVPTFTAFAVVNLLESHFGDLVDYAFTARMEDDLDGIAGGSKEAEPWLSKFYFGNGGAENGSAGLKDMVKDRLEAIDPRAINSIPLGTDGDGKEIALERGRFDVPCRHSVSGQPRRYGDSAD